MKKYIYGIITGICATVTIAAIAFLWNFSSYVQQMAKVVQDDNARIGEIVTFLKTPPTTTTNASK